VYSLGGVFLALGIILWYGEKTVSLLLVVCNRMSVCFYVPVGSGTKMCRIMLVVVFVC
jgi:hypothetical protein